MMQTSLSMTKVFILHLHLTVMLLFGGMKMRVNEFIFVTNTTYLSQTPRALNLTHFSSLSSSSSSETETSEFIVSLHLKTVSTHTSSFVRIIKPDVSNGEELKGKVTRPHTFSHLSVVSAVCNYS